MPGMRWVKRGPRMYRTQGTKGTAVSRGSAEQRSSMRLRSILQLPPPRTSRTEHNSEAFLAVSAAAAAASAPFRSAGSPHLPVTAPSCF